MEQNNTYPFYGPEDIKRYLSGSMNAQEMHDMEKAALKDPLLADAIDGFRNADMVIADQHLNDIRDSVLGINQKEHLVVSISQRNNWWRWAAAACSLGIIAGSIWWFTQKDQQKRDNTPVAFVIPNTEQQLPIATTPEADSSKKASVSSLKTGGKPSAPVVTKQTVTDISKPIKKTGSEKPKIATTSSPVVEITADAPLIATNNTNPLQQNVQGTKEMLLSKRNESYTPSQNELKAALTSEPLQMVYGKVTDKKGMPLKSATITFAPNKGTVSNADGSFAMPAGDTSVKAAVSMVGYRQTVTTLTPGKTNNIALAKDDQDLNETVVVGYAPKKGKGELGDFRKFKAKTETPKEEVIYPEDGWADFYKELSSDLGVDKSKATKTLQIKFTVDDNGDPVDFTIVESPDEILTRKAIEFIKKSKWKNFKLDKNALVKIEVN